jgi:hypothetical protein
MHNTKVKCSNCEYRLGHLLEYVDDKCPICDGSAKTAMGLPCRMCGETGMVPVVLRFVCSECGGSGEVDVNEDETMGV